MICVSFLLVASVSALAFVLARYVTRTESRISRLEEDTDHRRHTHSTIAGIEDAEAILVDWMIDIEANELRAQTVLKKLQTLRAGPQAYDVDTPAYKRKERK